MTIWTAAAGRRQSVQALRNGALTVLWAVLWLPLLGLMVSGVMIAGGFDLGVLLLLLG